MKSLRISNLNFRYSEADSWIFQEFSSEIELPGCVLVVGPNGAGKSTLLRLLAGKHRVAPGTILWDKKDPFEDLSLSRRVHYVNGDLPIDTDLTVEEILEASHRDFYLNTIDLNLEKELMDLLSIDPRWNLLKISDGQRRRVDLALSLRLKSVEVFLLDEVTTFLDTVARYDLCQWLRSQYLQKGKTFFLATHIFDDLFPETGAPELWPTQVISMDGILLRDSPKICAASLKRMIQKFSIRLNKKSLKTAG